MKAFPYNHHEGMELGMDLRDYFAAKAIEMMSAVYGKPEDIAKECYELADAMMEARKK